MPAADTTLYGVWKKVPTYTVKYEWTFEDLSTPPSSPYLSQPSSPYYAGQKRCGRNTDYIDGSTCVVNGQMYEFSGWTAYDEQGTAQLSDLEFDEYGYFTMPEQNVLFRGEWKKVLFLPTGALLSKVSYNEGRTIPGIAQGVIVECLEER